MGMVRGLLSPEANALLDRGLAPGIDPRKVEGAPSRDVHREQQAKARAEARRELLAAHGGTIPRVQSGAVWPSGHPLAPKPKETIAPAESPAAGVK